MSFDIAWHDQVPRQGRTGRERFPEGWLYEVAQWFPRMAVYDDVRGWNTEQYFGSGEFYLEYGDVDFAVTAPAGYTVTGTGVLTNAAQVLPAPQRAGSRRRCGPTRRSTSSRRTKWAAGAAPGGHRRDAHLALPRRQRARRGVGRGAQLHLGRERLGGHPDPGALPAGGAAAVGRGRRHGPPHDPAALRAGSTIRTRRRSTSTGRWAGWSTR